MPVSSGSVARPKIFCLSVSRCHVSLPAGLSCIQHASASSSSGLTIWKQPAVLTHFPLCPSLFPRRVQMSSRQPSQYSDPNEDRPTLPSIRVLFGPELSQTVPGTSHSRHPSSSPQIPFNNLHISDDPRYPPGTSRSMTPTPRTYPAYPQDPRANPQYVLGRSSTDPRHASSSQYQAYGQVPPMSSRQTGAMPSNAYPYSASLPPVSRHPSLPMPAGSSSSSHYPQEPERMASGHRYECSYCGKGFTRPSSLKIHINTHTGEKPYTCPFEGCGRSFSVQSNMRRHARVHTRNADSQADPEEESEEEPEPEYRGSSSSQGSRSLR
ncbi:unnamed protein product [Somion occarium]|uniref:C2H2-type domain-containing protein n=1 Tax=Somion occarium TaxID=3059160 RepID=A0ABP1DIE0_9APHY